jgi:glycosyltransferase involved in cell wall biosynthesis
MRPRILATMCVHNEADRYLRDVLEHLDGNVDGIAIFDDQSTDDTVAIARGYGRTKIRPAGCPSFVENEGLFRQHAWWWLREALTPSPDDWVLAIDADEFLVAGDQFGAHDHLQQFIDEYPGFAGRFNVPEVFGWDPDGTPLVRTDGQWGRITATRFCQWNHHPFNILALRGGGSLPDLAARPNRLIHSVKLVHFGYAELTDQQARYDRYNHFAGAHSSAHVASIITRPTLRPWNGQRIPVRART